jgi:HK97 family phage prohead protease
MTETEAEVRTREVLVRAFHVETQELDGRTLTVRAVPFGEVATVADPPDFQPYQEEFVPGVFNDQLNAVHRIRLRTDHDAIDGNGERKPGLAGVVGQGVTMREDSSGVLIDFRFVNTPEADTALELVRGGGYDGVSAEFVSKAINKANGVVQRVRAHLASVALAVGPAYSGAEILALRQAPEIVVDEELLPPAPDRELLERCAKLGIALPASMQSLIEEQVA